MPYHKSCLVHISRAIGKKFGQDGDCCVRIIDVEYAQQRSTFGGELDSALSFVLLNSNQVTSPATFFTAMSKLSGSFNWLYTSAQHIAYFHSGLYPIRAKGVDPDLPSWGTGQWEWQGFVSAAAHPQAVDPAVFGRALQKGIIR